MELGPSMVSDKTYVHWCSVLKKVDLLLLDHIVAQKTLYAENKIHMTLDQRSALTSHNLMMSHMLF